MIALKLSKILWVLLKDLKPTSFAWVLICLKHPVGHKNELNQAKSLVHLRFQQNRDPIKMYCQNNQNSSELKEVNYNKKWNQDLWFDYNNQLLFCQISKISSSTWVTNLLT